MEVAGWGEVLGDRVVDLGDVYLTTRGGKILGMGKTVEELGLEDWERWWLLGS